MIPRNNLSYSEVALENSISLGLFAEKHVLIVEDGYFLVDKTRLKLEQLGAIVLGPVATVRDALELIVSSHIDAAIFDIHLGDEIVFPVAEELEANEIAFVFATGYNPATFPPQFSGFALCEKPMELEKIAVALFGAGSSSQLN